MDKIDLTSVHPETVRANETKQEYHDATTPAAPNIDIHALIDNPLEHLSVEVLQRNVRQFAQDQDLTDISSLLERGAQVARDPLTWKAVAGLTEEEKQALADEQNHHFRQPFALWKTIILCSVGAALQGWDQTGSNSANLFWPKTFNMTGYNARTGDDDGRDVWLIGLVNAAPYLISGLVGCWLSDPLNLYFGRRGTIFFAAIFCLFSVLGSAFTQNWVELFICRMLLGVGMGAKASTVPIFAAENSPTSIRGSLVMGWQLWTAFGIFLGFSANLAVLGAPNDIVWRLQLGSALIPAVPLIFWIYSCPESPRWLIRKGRYRDAYNSLVRLRNTPLQAARDLYYVHMQLWLEQELLSRGQILMGDDKKGAHTFSTITVGNSYGARLVELFTIGRIRRSTLASLTVMLAQQMCGINIIAFYSGTIMIQANASIKSALLVSWGFGLVNFVFALPAVKTIDRYGRRFLLLFTFPHMAWTLLATGLAFLIPKDNSAHVPVIAFFVFFFAAFYSPGEGPVPFTYAAEVFPLSHREVGMSLSVAVNLFFAGVLTVVFPRMTSQEAMGPTGAICFFAGLNVLAFIMIFLWVPETKQRSLEELTNIFDVPVRKHMLFQTRVWLPWAFRKYFLRRGGEEPELYGFREAAEMESLSSREGSIASGMTGISNRTRVSERSLNV